MIRTILYRLITGFAAAGGFIFTILSRRGDPSFANALTTFFNVGIPFMLKFGLIIAAILLVLLFVLRKLLSNWTPRTWTAFELTFSLCVVLGCVWYGVAHSAQPATAHTVTSARLTH